MVHGPPESILGVSYLGHWLRRGHQLASHEAEYRFAGAVPGGLQYLHRCRAVGLGAGRSGARIQ
jgi:hypothetical protein